MAGEVIILLPGTGGIDVMIRCDQVAIKPDVDTGVERPIEDTCGDLGRRDHRRTGLF